MPRRRHVLSGLSLAIASSFLAGTGAFSSVSAERSVHVDVADDSEAFLRMEPMADSGLDSEPAGRSGTFGNEVWFAIPGKGPGENPNAAGVGSDSVYEFYDLVTIVNQGTQPVTLHSTYGGSNLDDLALIDDDGVLRDDPPELDVGEAHNVGLYIDTHDSKLGEFDETLTIVAERVGGDQD